MIIHKEIRFSLRLYVKIIYLYVFVKKSEALPRSCKGFAFWLVENKSYVVIPKEATSGASQKEVAVEIGNLKLCMYHGDITLADVDAIVNGTDIVMDLSKGNIS